MRDRQFYLLLLALENATQDQLDRLTEELRRLERRYTRNGVITDPVAYGSAVNRELGQYYDVFVEDMIEMSEKVTQLQVRNAVENILPILERAGWFQEATSFRRRVFAYQDAVQSRLLLSKRVDGLTLDFRIKTLKRGSQQTVRNIIANGVREGIGAKDLAKMIEQYINPNYQMKRTAPFEQYRKRFGRAKDFVPDGVPRGSVQHNAMRIARTETAHIYRTATLDFYEDREWVKGYRRVLSNRHPAVDECDDKAKIIYDTRQEAEDSDFHPNCLCDVQPVLMTFEELRQLARNVEQQEFEFAVAGVA